MEEQFHGVGDWGRNAGQGVRFAQEIQQAMGEDFELDPLFLEESWTLGVAAATESWQRRQRNQSERERQSRAFRELDSLGGLNFVQASDWVAAWLASVAAVATEEGRLAHNAEGPAVAAMEWPFSEPDPCEAWWEDGDCDEPMTQARACRLLGVDSGSTREQVRAAYRRMASQWHPDRRVGQVANERMATINEAYRVLREAA
jgi:hypothetical protein